MDRKHQIYFIQREDGLIKIGQSSDLETRLAQLRKSHGEIAVLKVINGDGRRERAVHYQFQQYNEYGEWFRPDPELVEAIAAIHDGSTITFRKSPERQAWADHEAEVAERLVADAKRLYSIFYRPGLDNQESTVARLCAKHTSPVWPFKHLLSGRCDKPSAALAERIRSAITAENIERRDFLVGEIDRLRTELSESVDDTEILDAVDALRAKHKEVMRTLQ